MRDLPGHRAPEVAGASAAFFVQHLAIVIGNLGQTLASDHLS